MFRGFIFSSAGITEISDPQAIIPHIKDPKKSVWIDLEDATENEIDFLIDEFKFHPLSIEDAILPQGQSKIEAYDDYIFLTLYAMTMNEMITPLELNIFYGKDYVITFHENKLHPIDKMISRVMALARKEDYNSRGYNLGKSADTILHAVIDTLVDEYFPIIDYIDDKIAEIEDEILEEKEAHVMRQTLQQKRNILILRKYVYLEKQVIGMLMKDDSKFIKPANKTYFKDIYDHISNMQETLEILREVVPSLIESYHSMTSKKLNSSIHRLTLLATIAIPMTVITSFYGMNLALPEFKWGIWGYFFMLGLMVVSSVGAYILLKAKKWL